MRNKILSCFSAGVFSIILSVFLVQNASAGGDLYVPAPMPEADVRAKSGWSGFYFGGGVGLRKMSADVGVDSENNFQKWKDREECRKVKKKVKVKETKKRKKRTGRCSWEWEYYTVTKKKTIYVKECNCYKRLVKDEDFNFSAGESVEGAWTAFGTAVIGYDYQFSSKFVAGVFADFDFGSSELDFNFAASSGAHHNANVSGSLKSDYAFTVGARLGYLIDEKTLAYGLIGYTRTSLSGHINADITDSRSYIPDLHMSKSFSHDVGGLTVGVGAERKFGSNWSARFEYRYTMLGNITEVLNGSNSITSHGYDPNNCVPGQWSSEAESTTTVNMDPDMHSVRAVISYRFNQ